MLRRSENEKASILTMAKQLLDRDKEKDERLSLLSEDNLQKAKVALFYYYLAKVHLDSALSFYLIYIYVRILLIAEVVSSTLIFAHVLRIQWIPSFESISL